MRTTVVLPDALMDAVGALATQKKATLRTIMAEALRQYLASNQGEQLAFKLKDGAVHGGAPQGGVDLADWAQIRSLVYDDARVLRK